MAENKPGETVSVVAEQIDADGQRISKLVYQTYGYDNALANAASITLVKGIIGTVEGWREDKIGGKPNK